MAIVAEGERGRVYLPPIYDHTKIAESAQPNNYPETNFPEQALGFRVQLYGLYKHFKLFTSHQLVCLTTLSEMVKKAREKVLFDFQALNGPPVDDQPLDVGGIGQLAYADAIAVYLGLGIDRLAMTNNSLVR